MSATAKSCLRWRQLSPKAAMNGGERYDQSTIEGQLTVSSKQTDCAAAVRDLADLERAVTSQPPAAVATGASPAQMRAATVASPPPARATMGSGAPQLPTKARPAWQLVLARAFPPSKLLKLHRTDRGSCDPWLAFLLQWERGPRETPGQPRELFSAASASGSRAKFMALRRASSLKSTATDCAIPGSFLKWNRATFFNVASTRFGSGSKVGNYRAGCSTG
jgi:hypothetical protein